MRIQRNHRTPVISKVRSMTEADLPALREKSNQPTIQKLRESHHWICRLLSRGLTYREIADATGYSVNRIAILANTPSVQEQVAVYRNRVMDALLHEDVTAEILKTDGINHAVRTIRDTQCAYDADGELMPLRDALAIHKTLAGNSSHNISINVGFAARLEAAVASTRRQLEHDPDA